MRSDIVSVLPVPAPALTTTSESAGACTTRYCARLSPPASSAAIERASDVVGQVVEPLAVHDPRLGQVDVGHDGPLERAGRPR